MRKSASIDTTVGTSGQENQPLDGSRVHNSRARNNRHGHTDDLRAENVRQKKSSVGSFGSSLDSIKVSSESQAEQAHQAHQAQQSQAHQAEQAERQTNTHQAERQKKFSLCTGSSYDSQMSSADKQLEQGRSRQRKLSLCLPSTQQPASLSSPKVQQWHSSTDTAFLSFYVKRSMKFSTFCSLLCPITGGGRSGASAKIKRSQTVQREVGFSIIIESTVTARWSSNVNTYFTIDH